MRHLVWNCTCWSKSGEKQHDSKNSFEAEARVGCIRTAGQFAKDFIATVWVACPLRAVTCFSIGDGIKVNKVVPKNLV